jgi:glucokinase
VGLAIGVDVGGTKVAAGVVDDDGKVLARDRIPTPSTSGPNITAAIETLVGRLRDLHDVECVGIGAAGFVNEERSVVRFAPNLAWRNEPLRDEVAARVDLPIFVENDANTAAWAEYRFGAGQLEPDLVMLTVGTGIGGGIVLGGRLHRGRYGTAGEPGHMNQVPGGRLCGCGNRGCWEQYCSGRALVRSARELATVAPAAAALMLELASGQVDAIDGPVVTEAARRGDPAAVECFVEIGKSLGQGMADLAALLDPGRFVLGGGVADAGELLLGPARREFEATLTGRGHRPVAEVCLGALGNDAGLIGAADLARQV